MTIISNRRRFVFVHIHKCGGTSIEKAYARHAARGDLILGSTRKGEMLQKVYRRFRGLHKHNPARSLRDILGADTWRDYRTTAVVRNPQKVLESFYKWSDATVRRHIRRRGGTFEEIRRQAAEGTGRAEFFRWTYVARYLATESFQEFVAETLRAEERVNTVDFVTDENGAFMVDDIIRLEDMDSIVDLFRKVTGDPGFTIGHANKGSDMGALEWDPADLRRFQELNHDAYARFGYDV